MPFKQHISAWPTQTWPLAVVGVMLALACHHDSHFEATLQDATDFDRLPPAATRRAVQAHVAVRGPRLPIRATKARVASTDGTIAQVFPVARGVVLAVAVQEGATVAVGDRLFQFSSSELTAPPAGPKQSLPRSALRDETGFVADPTTFPGQLRQARDWSPQISAFVNGLPPHVHRDNGGNYWATAPRKGTVHQLRVTPSSRLSPREGLPLLAIGDLGNVAVVGEYHLSQAPEFRVGQSFSGA